jgi:hypothetical protein
MTGEPIDFTGIDDRHIQTLKQTKKLKLSRDEKLEINLIAAAILSHQHVPEPREASEKNFLQAGRQLPPHPRSSDMDFLYNQSIERYRACAQSVLDGEIHQARDHAIHARNQEKKLEKLMAEARANMRTERKFDKGSWNLSGTYWIEIDGTKFTFQLEIVWSPNGKKLEVKTAINKLNTRADMSELDVHELNQRHADLCRWILEHDTGNTRGRKLAGDDTAIFRENGSSLSLRDAIETNYSHLVQALEAIRQTLKLI